MLLRAASTVLLLLISVTAFAGGKKDKKMAKALRADITYLASDELKGRRTGTEGEQKAGDYLIARYKALGIPSWRGEYRHPFTFTNGKSVGDSTRIEIGDRNMSSADAFPLPFSANKMVETTVLPQVHEQGNVWLLPLYANAEDAKDAHFDWEKSAYEAAKSAIKERATGIVFYDAYGAAYPPEFNRHSEHEALNIPVVFLSKEGMQHAGISLENSVPVALDVHLVKPQRTGNNVAAYINNGAAYTVVLGAHYDHLGLGEDGSSLYAGKEHLVHHGADDNASGTAALLQMAGDLKKQKGAKYNYLIVHFSGEELGLFGSKAFVKEDGIDSNHIAYMINMDMVGRLVDSTRALTLGGLGTSPAWSSAVDIVQRNGFKIVRDSSGIGPSDHTSFYNRGIPVLFFFTGTHRDYHKPTDEADKINYPGEVAVIRCIEEVVQSMNDMPKPRFTPTKQSALGRVRFKVTLGIMPDYSYDNGGVKVDGVSEGKPAAAAGIKAGDIITGLGKDKVQGMQSYMEALSRLKEGQKTTVIIQRDGKEIRLPIQLR